MTIEKSRQGAELTVALEGRLDTVSAPELDAVVKNELEGVDTFILDLKKLHGTLYHFPHSKSTRQINILQLIQL